MTAMDEHKSMSNPRRVFVALIVFAVAALGVVIAGTLARPDSSTLTGATSTTVSLAAPVTTTTAFTQPEQVETTDNSLGTQVSPMATVVVSVVPTLPPRSGTLPPTVSTKPPKVPNKTVIDNPTFVNVGDPKATADMLPTFGPPPGIVILTYPIEPDGDGRLGTGWVMDGTDTNASATYMENQLAAAGWVHQTGNFWKKGPVTLAVMATTWPPGIDDGHHSAQMTIWSVD